MRLSSAACRSPLHKFGCQAHPRVIFYTARAVIDFTFLVRARSCSARETYRANLLLSVWLSQPSSVSGRWRGPPPARALTFDLTYVPSILFSAPAGFQTAFQDAINLYQTTYTNQITFNIDVGWGEIDGNPLNPRNLGQSRTSQPGNFTYSQVRNALINDAKSAADFQAISTWGVTDSTGGCAFRMSDAEAKALGLHAANAPVSTAG